MGFFPTSYGIGWCAEPIRLGFAGPLSGELSSYGISTLRGVELAIEEVNKRGGILGRWVDLYVEEHPSNLMQEFPLAWYP
ncbi:MAG: ABC transporter substrate-binding protein [Thermodesulfobacteriota bacterium]